MYGFIVGLYLVLKNTELSEKQEIKFAIGITIIGILFFGIMTFLTMYFDK